MAPWTLETLSPVTSLTITGESSARSTRTSPPPIRVIGASWSGSTLADDDGWNTSVCAVLISSCLMSWFDRNGRAALRIAAAPETIGAAPEVPPNAAVPVKLPDIADTDAPGAPISGFTMLSSKRGPREDVEASDPASDAMLAGSKRTEAVPVRSMFASAWLIM